jgi:hypothetical protein
MKRFYVFPLLAVLVPLLWIGDRSPLSAATKGRKAGPETLNTQKDLPQKYSKPSEAVKTFFTAFKDKDFDLAWESLSAASKDQFVRSFATGRRISPAQARDLFDKNKESVRLEFWTPLRDRSRIVPLVQDAVYTETDEKDNQAMVEMKSGGVTNHVKAVKEGKEWRMGYVESALQDDRAPPRTTGKESQKQGSPESAP